MFGINMSLYDANDQLLTDPAVQSQFATMQVPYVRVPMRTNLSDQTLESALQVVKTIGATPLVIVPGPGDVSNLQQVDAHDLALVQSVFGGSAVLVEFGNEDDLDHGVDAQAYTQAWNQVVPTLAAASPPSYRFGGPTNFQANPQYIAYFVAHATPRPAFVSWHAYACGTSDSDQTCYSNTEHWAVDVQSTDQAMSAAIGTTLPIILSEWNLDPNNQDPRYQDAAFIGPWVTFAAQELEHLQAQGLAAAMFYTATNNPLALVASDGSLTPEGSAWSAALQASVPASPAPSPGPPAPAPGPSPSPPAPSPSPPTAAPGPVTPHLTGVTAVRRGSRVVVTAQLPAGWKGKVTVSLMRVARRQRRGRRLGVRVLVAAHAQLHLTFRLRRQAAAAGRLVVVISLARAPGFLPKTVKAPVVTACPAHAFCYRPPSS
ncbi:MAG TPA: hypothetical protein VKV27_16590 [Solirubrobacteraceae bacterium]|nr:hypothetical protein [Solirubrobacteraceae bacterium]